MEKQRLYIRGWKHSREMILDRDGGKIMLEIALSHDHCPTCARRIRHVSEALTRRNIPHTWEYLRGEASYIVLDYPGYNNFRFFLAEALQLEFD
jgi:hypothetical protein